jgi:malate dehydrogenase (oxaloacetate-decarboxylating)
MSAVPSASYSITVRLEVPAGGTSVSQLTTAVESAGGSVTALDVTASGHDRLRIDVTIAARDTEHAEQLVEAMRSVPGVSIGKVSDRTFLMHLGGKIEMQSKHPIHNRDDLSMIYTPGVARVSLAIAAKPGPFSPLVLSFARGITCYVTALTPRGVRTTSEQPV